MFFFALGGVFGFTLGMVIEEIRSRRYRQAMREYVTFLHRELDRETGLALLRRQRVDQLP